MADDERRAEIEAAHEGCLERACECVQDEIASLRRLNQVLAPRYPIVNVPVDTLNAIAKRAEDAESALDRVRDARGNDEAQDAAAYHRVCDALWPYWSQQESMTAEEAVKRLVLAARSPQAEGSTDNPTDKPPLQYARSPQDENHERRCGRMPWIRGGCALEYGHEGDHVFPVPFPQGEDHDT